MRFGYLKLNINETQTEPKGNQYLEIRIYFDKDYQGGGEEVNLFN